MLDVASHTQDIDNLNVTIYEQTTTTSKNILYLILIIIHAFVYNISVLNEVSAARNIADKNTIKIGTPYTDTHIE